MNHVWSAPLFGRSTCFFLNYCILTWRNIIFCHETPTSKTRKVAASVQTAGFNCTELGEQPVQSSVPVESIQENLLLPRQ